MNTGIFPPVCRPLYPISIETEYIARIEKKSLTKGKCMYIEYVSATKRTYFNTMQTVVCANALFECLS